MMSERERLEFRQRHLVETCGQPLLYFSLDFPKDVMIGNEYKKMFISEVDEIENMLSRNHMKTTYHHFVMKKNGYESYIVVSADPEKLRARILELACNCKNDLAEVHMEVFHPAERFVG